MSDNITLPREVVERALRVAEVASKHAGLWTADPLIDDIRTRLAAPRPEPGLMELAQQMKPLDADMAAILHANLDSLYITDEPAAVPSEDIEALRRDAERYRWLRRMIYDDRIIVEADRMLHGEVLDAAIDAAMEDKT